MSHVVGSKQEGLAAGWERANSGARGERRSSQLFVDASGSDAIEGPVWWCAQRCSGGAQTALHSKRVLEGGRNPTTR